MATVTWISDAPRAWVQAMIRARLPVDREPLRWEEPSMTCSCGRAAGRAVPSEPVSYTHLTLPTNSLV